MEEEIWLPVIGYEGLYEVSDQGRVRSLNYNHTGRVQLLKPTMNNDGYLHVGLCQNGKRKQRYVHRLAAEAFLTNTEALPEVNHKDECKTNNSVDNLEWCDRLRNMRYGTAISRRAVANTNGKRSKPVQQLSLDGALVAVWTSIHEAERVTGISKGNICRCCNGKRHSTGGFIWRYAE